MALSNVSVRTESLCPVWESVIFSLHFFIIILARKDSNEIMSLQSAVQRRVFATFSLLFSLHKTWNDSHK